jgi:nicotinamidase-related amidase
VDTILVTGVTASACVRQTVCDGLAEGFRPIVVKEAVGDRIPGAVLWNLFDMDPKFADVEPVDRCLEYLSSVGATRRSSVA